LSIPGSHAPSLSAAHIGKYRLIAELGHGGMAEVFLAVVKGPAGFNKLVVVKQIRPQLAEDPEFLGMFLDEARLAARLSHPNVVQTNEVGNEGNRYFIAMEYLEGQPLNRVIHRLSRAEGLPLAMHLRVIIDVLSGLHHAHELTDYDGTPLGVVHRDVTPHNVFLTYDGQVKVVDFGIAKAMNSSAETRTGVLKGKVAYMAPEQARGERVDRRADIFSVGVLLWEAATGKRLWKGVPDITILQRLLSGDIPAPSTLRPEVLPGLEHICLRALSNRREDRYATAAELQAELEAFLEDIGSRANSREVGKLVGQHFEADRAKIRALIDEQLRGNASRLPMINESTQSVSATGMDRVSVPVMGNMPSMSPSNPGSFTAASGLSSSTNVPTSSLGARPRRGLVAGLALLGGAGLAVVFWMMTRAAPKDAVASAPSATATAPAQATPSTPANPTATAVEVHVTASPKEAKIFVDDSPVSGNPFKGKLPKDGKTHQIRVEADGYVSRTRDVVADKDLHLELALPREEKAAEKPADKAGSAPAQRRSSPPPPPPPKDDDMSRPVAKPKRTLDSSNPYNK
jgi:eukaryotic-like serine/threonine-protein kinase